jgi:hypothetical protein
VLRFGGFWLVPLGMGPCLSQRTIFRMPNPFEKSRISSSCVRFNHSRALPDGSIWPPKTRCGGVQVGLMQQFVEALHGGCFPYESTGTAHLGNAFHGA